MPLPMNERPSGMELSSSRVAERKTGLCASEMEHNGGKRLEIQAAEFDCTASRRPFLHCEEQ